MSVSPVPEAAQMRARLDEWTRWLDGQTDRLLALDERAKMSGSPADQGDVAAAFVARKAIGDRLAAIGPLIDKNRREAAALMGKPLTDSLGGPVGKDIDDGAKLLDAIITAVEQRLAVTEQQQVVDIAQAQAIEADLAVAERLARELGEQVNQVALLRQQQAARRDLPEVAATAAKVRAGLEQNDRERQRVLASFSVAPDRIQRLADREAGRAPAGGALRGEDPARSAPGRAVGGGARRRSGSGAARRPAVEGGAGTDRAVRRQARPPGAGARRSCSAFRRATRRARRPARPARRLPRQGRLATASPRTRRSSPSTARRATCCGPRRATSTRRGHSSGSTSPR